MIRSYGLFWEKNKIFWGKPKKPGRLLGAASRASKAIRIDFREQRGIYALYAGFDLVYIGQTGSGENRLLKRLKQHTEDHLADRWDKFSWFGTERVTKKHALSCEATGVHEEVVNTLNILEAVAIAISEPQLNLQRGRWSKVKKYFQVAEVADELSATTVEGHDARRQKRRTGTNKER